MEEKQQAPDCNVGRGGVIGSSLNYFLLLMLLYCEMLFFSFLLGKRFWNFRINIVTEIWLDCIVKVNCFYIRQSTEWRLYCLASHFYADKDIRFQTDVSFVKHIRGFGVKKPVEEVLSLTWMWGKRFTWFWVLQIWVAGFYLFFSLTAFSILLHEDFLFLPELNICSFCPCATSLFCLF